MAKNNDKKQAQSTQPFDPQVPKIQSKTQPQGENCKGSSAKN